jgi:hypothetical protein
MRAAALIVHTILFAAAAGCSFAPPYTVPDTAKTPPRYKEEPGDWKVAQPQDAAPRGTWWTLYGDADLNALEGKIRDSNLTLRRPLPDSSTLAHSTGSREPIYFRR